MKLLISLVLLWVSPFLFAQSSKTTFDYKVQLGAMASHGSYAPFWMTANQFGIWSNQNNQFVAQAALSCSHEFRHSGVLEAGVEMASGAGLVSDFWIHQAYAAYTWKRLSFSIGSRETLGFPLSKNEGLTSGWMVEGPNARPVPQVRVAVSEYLSVPGTAHWLAFKGHLAYGWFTDDKWQKNFVGDGNCYTEDVLYHSKSLMFRLGNRRKFPLEFEFGLLMATQFGGAQYKMHADANRELITKMPHGLKAYWNALLPSKSEGDVLDGEKVNVEGNMLGSWNFSFNWYPGQWKFKTYLEHYFEDHSQMFWEYGRWRDGQLGIEIVPPENSWLTAVVWEGLSTKYSSGSVLYDGFMGSFGDLQMSGGDTYYNHYIYQAWQHYGMGMGNPLLPGPLYNDNGEITFRSNRVRSNHLGLSGQPIPELSWRLLASFTRHWGSYTVPLDKQRKQFSSLLQLVYQPKWTSGWKVKVSMAMDRGNYLGNSWGGMLSICKTGGFSL